MCDITLIEVALAALPCLFKSMFDITLIEVPLAALPCLFKSMCDITLIEVPLAALPCLFKSMCDITLIEVPLAALPCLFKSMCCICLKSAKTSSSCLSKAGQLADLDITLIEVASCPASLRSAKSLCYAYALNRHDLAAAQQTVSLRACVACVLE
jgi:hypothetical protein